MLILCNNIFFQIFTDFSSTDIEQIMYTEGNKFSNFSQSRVETYLLRGKLFEPGHGKMCLMSYANNKGADQPAQSAQRLCCSLLRISRFYNRNFKTLASFCGCAGRFVSGLVGNSRRHIFSWRGSFCLCCTSISIILGTRNTNFDVERLFIDQNCIGFIPKGSTKTCHKSPMKLETFSCAISSPYLSPEAIYGGVYIFKNNGIVVWVIVTLINVNVIVTFKRQKTFDHFLCFIVWQLVLRVKSHKVT